MTRKKSTTNSTGTLRVKPLMTAWWL